METIARAKAASIGLFASRRRLGAVLAHRIGPGLVVRLLRRWRRPRCAERPGMETNVETALMAVQRDVAEARSWIDRNQAVQLLEANEQLVQAMLQARAEAETSAQALKEMSHSAERDMLTRLPNRVRMLDRLGQAIVKAKRDGTCLALLFLDLDNFKQINDGLGHALGDAVLKVTAACLSSSVREVDTVSRHGGDEFLILLNEVSEVNDAVQVAIKLAAAVAAPMCVAGHEILLTASIGISIYPGDGDDVDMLIERADAAMYRAKNHCRGGYALHGQPAVGSGVASDTLLVPLTPSSAGPDRALAEHGRRHDELGEANELLVQVALRAQELQVVAEQALRRQTEFLAVLAHELRNPLAAIQTAAAILGRGKDDDVPRMQALINRQVRHMSRLVGDLLDVSCGATGKLRLELQRIDLADVLESTLASFRVATQVRQHHLTVDMPAGKLELQGDSVRLAQVVNNLLDNASKYTPNGGEIGLSVTAGHGTLVLTVSDNGIGITAAAVPHIFDPFVQEAHAIGFSGVGLGIGLTVVRKLIEAHGGTVVATSAGIGHGSEFVVTLPAANLSTCPKACRLPCSDCCPVDDKSTTGWNDQVATARPAGSSFAASS